MSGIVDIPSAYEDKDSLGIDRYAQALIKFITQTDTPLTIGVQGEWGSGKTSLLNTLYGELAAQGKYKQIWINSWEHSLLSTPEESLISITNEIVSEILGADVSSDRTKKIKGMATKLLSGAAKVGATVALGAKAGNVVEDLIDTTEDASIKKLRNELEALSYEIRNRESNPYKRIIVYVDDLDRIEPKNAVALLELLKNIFSISGCIFVLAIDYQVVVKGLEHKFGPRTPKNEWEFRAFFDKIIQLPFMMPISQYNIGTYINDLLKKIDFIEENEVDTNILHEVAEYTIGGNPRALKRLVNALSLIEIFSSEKQELNHKGDEKPIFDYDSGTRKLLLFSLVCLQISYPDIYNLLMKNPNYENWQESWLYSVTHGNEETEEAFDSHFKAAQETEEFDEEWERVLYRACYTSPRYRARVADISKLMNLIKNSILESVQNNGEAIAEVLSQTAVTSVTTNDEPQQRSSKKRVLTNEYKLKILQEIEDAGRGHGAKILKRESLYYSQVNQWKKDKQSGKLS